MSEITGQAEKAVAAEAPAAPDLRAQLAALISTWRGSANDCKLTGDPSMQVTATAMIACADQAEALLNGG